MSTPVSESAQPRTERIARLLASNDPPLDIEEQTFRVVITQGQTRLIEIDEQIADIRAALESLLLQRGQLQTHIEDHKAVMNPIRRLPADILSVIFAFHAPPVDVTGAMGEKTPVEDSLDVKTGPWILGRVCRRWKSVAQELPMLWSGLNIVCDPVHVGNRPLHHSQYLLGRHLRNAKSVPLSIGLISVDDLDDTNPLLHALTPYSEQWKKLRLLFFEHSSCRCMSYIKGQVNSLEYLHLVAFIEVTDHPLEPYDAFSFAPQLRELTVRSIPSVWLILLLPWSQITTYKWSRWYSEERLDTSHHIAALQLMSNLEECVLECEGSGGGSASLDRSIQLLRLRKLRLIGLGGTALLDLLACIRAPALHDMSITHEEDNDFGGIGVVKDFIVRSSCPLATLALPPASTLTDQDLLQLFKHAPSLSKISLASDVLTDHLLGQLRYRGGADGSVLPVAPNLHSITIKNLTPASNFTPESFFDMIASRWSLNGDDGHMMGRVARLRSIELVWKDEPPSSLLEDPRLAQFRSEGLHIVCISAEEDSSEQD